MPDKFGNPDADTVPEPTGAPVEPVNPAPVDIPVPAPVEAPGPAVAPSLPDTLVVNGATYIRVA